MNILGNATAFPLKGSCSVLDIYLNFKIATCDIKS